MIKWSCGVTAATERIRSGLLAKTMQSLEAAGFDAPRVFIDSIDRAELEYTRFAYRPISVRHPCVNAYANWVLAVMELYLREPKADLYVLFQDDILAVKNLRSFLETQQYPENGYWNLITYPCNLARKPSEDYQGWFKTDQMGRGGQGLVFTREALTVLFSHKLIFDHPHEFNGPRSIDGTVSKIFRDRGWTEYVHSPGLLGHTGQGCSVIGKRIQPTIEFVGEGFDAMNLVTNHV